jgi:hypothetical protein
VCRNGAVHRLDICIEPTESSPIIHFNVGLTVGWVEGIEVNILGAVAGVDFRRPALKLPGLGRLGAVATPCQPPTPLS